MRATRREALLIGGGAIGSLVAPPNAFGAAAETDADVLRATLQVELLVGLAYSHAAQELTISPGTHRLVQEVLAHEHAHARALTSSLLAMGAAPVRGPLDLTSLFGAAHLPGGSAKPVSEQDWLRVLLTAEGLAEGAYYTAVGKLRDPTLLQLAAEILGSEAQHAALLGEHLYHDVRQAVGYAFVQGTH